jgi:hypothetical protein
MIDSELRTLLHERLGPALDGLSAPDLLSGVRARQVRHKRSVRAGLVGASAAGVAAVAVAAAVWPYADSAGPAASAPSISVTAVPSAAASALPSPAPSPSTAIVNLAGLAPLVTSGPCAGLTVGAYLESRDLHPPVTALNATGVSFAMGSGGLLDLKAKGPCLDRLSYVPRTAHIQGAFGTDLPFQFHDGSGTIYGRSTPTNQTAFVQLFLDCRGLVCSESGTPLATITIHVSGQALGSGSLPFPAAPSAIPLPTGQVVVVPSMVGLSVDAAVEVLTNQGFTANSGPPGTVDNRKVTSQDPRAGSTVMQGSPVQLFASGPAPTFSRPPAPTAGAGQPSAARPSLPPPATAPMPAVVGLQLAHAEKVLTKANIVYAVTYAAGPEPAGIVLAQSPAAGAVVRVQSRIQLTVAGPKP